MVEEQDPDPVAPTELPAVFKGFKTLHPSLSIH